MFSEFYVLSAILVWIMPLMAIAGSIFRKDLLPSTTWKAHILLGVIFAAFVSYINLKDRDSRSGTNRKRIFNMRLNIT